MPCVCRGRCLHTLLAEALEVQPCPPPTLPCPAVSLACWLLLSALSCALCSSRAVLGPLLNAVLTPPTGPSFPCRTHTANMVEVLRTTVKAGV